MADERRLPSEGGRYVPAATMARVKATRDFVLTSKGPARDFVVGILNEVLGEEPTLTDMFPDGGIMGSEPIGWKEP